MHNHLRTNTPKTGKFHRKLLTFFSSILLFLALLLPSFVYADALGEHILAAILRNEKPGDAALLLLTRDLKWYEQNMGNLPQNIQARVQQLRVNAGGEASQMAAKKLNEAGSVFAATGSWKPGRDMDIIYFGKNGDLAASTISDSYETVTGRILADAGDDPILRSFQQTGGTIPRALPAECLAVCTTELPNYGYSDLQKAYKKAQEALARGESKEEIMKAFQNEIRTAMGSNMKAHFAAASNPDYYAGATGQEWFRKTYLNDTEKMRVFAQDAEGNWALRPGGIDAVPKEIVERIGFGSFGTGQVKFSKIASDYSLFFSHIHGGPSDNAKYAMRVWSDMGLNAIQNLTDDELRILATAKIISKNPNRAAQILTDMGIGSIDEFNEGIARILHGWTESQLLLNMERIVTDLSASSGKTVDELEKLLKQSKASMELNEIVAGLNKLSAVPNGKAIQAQLLERLQAKFGNTDSGKAAIRLILKNLGLLGDTGELTARIMNMLAKAGRITDAEAEAFRSGRPLSGRAQVQVNQVKKELLALNAGAMVEFDNALDLEKLMNDWRSSQPGAILQSADDDIGKIINELHELPDTELRSLGWTAEEIATQNRIRNYLRSNKQVMPSLGARLQNRLAKAGIKLSDVQSDIRKMMFNPAYTKLGDPSMSVGAFDAVIGSAAALFQTYTILNGPSMKEEDENIALSNAWVTAIPVVGDFAQALITGSEAYWEGDKGKMLDAGLWMAVGITGMIPGGQLPAVIGSMMLALKPVAGGVYEAKQAQNLVQAWIESGKWSTGKPPALEGIYDRDGLLHRLTYEDILGTKGEVKYDSTKIKSLPFGEFTIAQSVRDYANKYVLAGNKNVDVLRENLKTLFPDLSDNILNDLAYAERKVNEKNSKLAKMFFKAYERQVRGAYLQTITHLKKWAEDERRVAKDYDGEVKRLRSELAALEKELKNASLVKHADDTVNSYSKMATNFFEQESLPLSRVRIYENYIAVYKDIKIKLQSVTKLFTEASSKFVPSSWFLTGYPVFDKDITGRLVTLMTTERSRSADRVVELLKDLNQKDTYLNLQNECHKKAFDIVASQRYKIAFVQHLSEYYRGLAGESSKWSDAYESAKASYESTRDNLLKNIAPPVAMMDNAYTNAFTTFFFAMGFAIASNDADAYKQVADSYEAQLVALREHDKSDRLAGTESEAGKALSQCLKIGMQLEILLSTATPEAGADVEATVKLATGTLPKETFWAWETKGGLTAKPLFGEKTVIRADSEGELTVRLMDDRYTKKSIAEAKVKIIPKMPKLTLTLRGPQEGETGKSLVFAVEPSTDGTLPKDIQYEWKVDSQTAGSGREISRSFSKAGSIGVSVDAYRMIGGKKVLLDSARQKVVISDLTAKKDEAAKKQKEKEKLEKEKAEKEREERERKEKEAKAAGKQPEKPGVPVSDDKQAAKTGYENVKISIDGLKNRMIYGQKTPVTVTITGMSAGATQSGGGRYDGEYVGSVKSGEQCSSLDPKAIKAKQEDSAAKGAKQRQDGWSRTTRERDITIECCKDRKGNYVPCTKAKDQDIKVAWQASPNVTFDGHTQSTSVTFDRMGVVKIWAQVKIKTEKGIQAFESDQQEVTVVAPKFLWSFDPKKGAGQIGREVKASITTDPFVDPALLSYEWSMPESSSRMEYDKNASVIGFTPKNASPVKLLVAPKTPYHREHIGGGLLEEYQASGFAVTITGPRARQEFQIWKCETQLGGAPSCGMKKVENQFAVDNEILFSSKIEPMPDKPVSYNWTASPSGCTIASPFSKDIGMKCSTTGNFSVTVKAKSDNIDLGSATTSVNVSISQNDVNNSKKAKDAYDKLQKAKELVNQGKLDEGINLADEASKLDPKNTEAATLKNKWKGEKDKVQANLRNLQSLIKQDKITEAVKELSEAQKLHPKYPPVIEAEKLLKDAKAKTDKQKKEIADKIAKAKELVLQGKLDEGITLTDEVLKLDPKNTEATTLATKWKGEKNKVQTNLRNLQSLIKQNKIPEAEKELSEAQKLHPKYPPVTEAEKLLKDAKAKADKEKTDKQKKEIADKIAKAKELVLQGKLDEGINLTDEVLKLDPKNTEASTLGTKWKGEKQTITKHVESIKKLITLKRIVDAEKELSLARKPHPKYGPIIETEKLLNEAKKQVADEQKTEDIARTTTTAKESLKQNKLDEAKKAAEELIKKDPSNAEAKNILKQINEAKEKDVKSKALVNEAANLEKDKNYKKALEKYKEANALIPNPDAQKKIVELENTEKKALSLINEGDVSEKQGDIPQALKKYKSAYEISPDETLAKRIADLEAKQSAQQVKVELAQQERDRGEVFEKQNRIPEAIAKYKEYMKYVPTDQAMARRIANLETKQKAQQVKVEYAQRERDQGEVFEKQNRIPEAIAKYKEYMKYVPDDAAMEKHIADLEIRQKAQQVKAEYAQKVERAQQERDRGEVFEKQNRIPEAIAKYKEYMKYVPTDQAMAKRISYLEMKQSAQQVKIEYAQKERAQGEVFEKQNRIPEAIAKYEEYMKYVPTDQAMAKHISNLQYAQREHDLGAIFEIQNKIPEAIAKFKEYMKYVPTDQAMAKHISNLERKLAEDQQKVQYAMQLREQGENFQKQNKIPEAIAKYKEYMKYMPNDQAMAKYISDLEGRIADDQKKTRYAMQLRAQGEALQKQNKISEAIAKYKEYMTYMPNDEAMLKHIGNLERKAAEQQQKAQYAQQERDKGKANRTQEIKDAIISVNEKVEQHYASRPVEAPSYGKTGSNDTSRPIDASSWTGNWKSQLDYRSMYIILALFGNGKRISGSLSFTIYNSSTGRETEILNGTLEGTLLEGSRRHVTGVFREAGGIKRTFTFNFTSNAISNFNQFECVLDHDSFDFPTAGKSHTVKRIQ